eukprot:PhF_6_TR29251/c0_g1_i1/m.42818
MVRPSQSVQSLPTGSRICVVGSGVAGLVVAHFLAKYGNKYQITIIEKANTIGMDDHSVDVTHEGKSYRVDVPIRAVSSHYYSNLMKLYKHLGLSLDPVNYSFSMQIDGESKPFFSYWNALGFLPITRLGALVSKRTWRIMYDMVRYTLTTPALLRRGALAHVSFYGDMKRRGFSNDFIRLFLLPVLGVTLSCTYQQVELYPAENIAYYLLGRRTTLITQWYRVRENIRGVVDKLIGSLTNVKPITGVSVSKVIPKGKPDDVVQVILEDGSVHVFDSVVLALEAPTALSLLGSNASPQERSVLQSFQTVTSQGIVHQDPRVLRETQEGSKDVYIVGPPAPHTESSCVQVTINMGRILKMPSACHVLQTWNHLQEATSPIQNVVSTPKFTRSLVTVESERVLREGFGDIQGVRGVFYCGSYCVPNGVTLLEQAVTSGLDVVEALHVQVPFVVQRGPPKANVLVSAVSEVIYYQKTVAVVAGITLLVYGTVKWGHKFLRVL